jgi:hypothetical protein
MLIKILWWELDNVQFADESLNRTYYDASGGGATNHLLTLQLARNTKIINLVALRLQEIKCQALAGKERRMKRRTKKNAQRHH